MHRWHWIWRRLWCMTAMRDRKLWPWRTEDSGYCLDRYTLEDQ